MRAKPLLTYGLVASALAMPGAAWALGLGRLTVDSALGQPLSARIELTSATRDELETLSAKVADPSLYRQNNLTYQGVLARTRVAVETAGGTPFLRVTSPVAVTEPFLDLMVELNWAAGRVVREYTFLLDPPGAAAPAMAEPVTPPRTGASRPAPAAAQSSAAPAAARAAAPIAAPSVGGNQYTVKRGDTLAGIAGAYKPESATLEQMLAALFKGNPSAFDDNNMNRLRRGSILTLPAPAEVTGTDAAEATRVVRMQAADWRNYRSRVAASVPASEGGGNRASTGRIGAVAGEATPAAPPGRDQIKIQPSSGKGAAADDLAAQALRDKDKDARIAALEKTVKDLQTALQLKGQLPGVPAQPATDAAKGKAPEPAVVAPPPAVATAPAAPAPAVTPPAVTPAPATPPAAEPAKAAEPPKPADATPPAPPKVETKAPPPKVAPKPAPGFFEDLLANTPLWAIGAGAAAVLAGLAALFAARRRKATKFEDSIISGTDIKTNTVFGSTGGGVVNTGENSLASDFSREGLGNIDTDEVDPIAEAEVYLAYGRDAQAEEILKDALKKDPQRQEIYLKLLEIHSQHNKPSAFETVASELYSVSGGQGEVWQKAMALGRQLDPANPLFTEAGGSAFAATPAAAAAAAAAEPPASDTQVFSVPPEHKAEPRVATPLDFSLDDDISLAPSSGEEPKTPAAILAGAAQEVAKSSRAASESFDKSSAFPGTVSGAAAAKSGASEKFAPVHDSLSLDPESVPKFDLDFHLDEPVRAAPPAAQPKPAPEPERAFATAGAPAPQLARPAAAIELDKLDLAFDPDRSTFEDPTPSVLDGQWHDAATKLDLAKAYQEMGDVEGAREILQEVLHEGDDEQKSEAKTLLSKLA